MIQFIPANLHIQEFVNAHPPTNIKNFNIDKLTHIISLVISIPANNKDLLIKNGFIPFYSPYVQRIVKNYRSYLDYLLEHKIFLSNNHYVVGETSKGYKYSSGFCGAIKAVTNLNAGVVRLLKRQHIIPPTKMVKYKHIIRWYDEFLKIDYPL